MWLYRVFPYLPRAAEGEPGHPLYVHPGAGSGRVDSSDGSYRVAYYADSPAGAIGETFGDLDAWSDAMLTTPSLPGARRALASVAVPDSAAILDLDDGPNLAKRGIRPSQVVHPSHAVSREWAQRVRGEGVWSGVRWWSFWYPAWGVVAMWDLSERDVVKVEELDRQHPAFAEANSFLRRPWTD